MDSNHSRRRIFEQDLPVDEIKNDCMEETDDSDY